MNPIRDKEREEYVERTINRKIAFQGKLLKLEVLEVRTRGEKISTREIVRHPGAVAILILRDSPRGEEVLLVEQYRKAIESFTLEVPAGKLDIKDGRKEDPLDCAVREIKEETGLEVTPSQLEYLGKIYTTPGFTDEIIHIFRLKVNSQAEVNPIDLQEISLAKWIPLSELKEMILKGIVNDAKTLAALLYHLLSSEEG